MNPNDSADLQTSHLVPAGQFFNYPKYLNICQLDWHKISCGHMVRQIGKNRKIVCYSDFGGFTNYSERVASIPAIASFKYELLWLFFLIFRSLLIV